MSTILVETPQSSKYCSQRADPNRGRCLIENCSTEQAVEIAHVFNRNPETFIIDSLEWHWGMKRGTLNLDTRQNVFFLGPSLHQLYLERRWALVPEQGIVSQYFGVSGFPLKRNKFPNIIVCSVQNITPAQGLITVTGGIFRYRFLPIQELDDIYICRQGTDNGRVVIHNYPFEDLPVIVSNVHPKGEILQNHPWLKQVRELYLRWTSEVPDDAAKNPTYMSSEINHVFPVIDNLNTPQRRIPVLETRNEHESIDINRALSISESSLDSCIAVGGKRKRSTADEGCKYERSRNGALTSDLLAKFDQRNDLGDVTWTSDRVSRWAQDCFAQSYRYTT